MLCVTDPSFKRCNYCDNFKIHKYTDNMMWSLRTRDFLGTGMCAYHKNFVNCFEIRTCDHYKETIHNWYNIPKDEYWLFYVILQLRKDFQEETELHVVGDRSWLNKRNYDLREYEKQA